MLQFAGEKKRLWLQVAVAGVEPCAVSPLLPAATWAPASPRVAAPDL